MQAVVSRVLAQRRIGRPEMPPAAARPRLRPGCGTARSRPSSGRRSGRSQALVGTTHHLVDRARRQSDALQVRILLRRPTAGSKARSGPTCRSASRGCRQVVVVVGQDQRQHACPSGLWSCASGVEVGELRNASCSKSKPASPGSPRRGVVGRSYWPTRIMP